MASYKYTVANPVPMLAIVNGPKGGKMATKKKPAAKKATHHRAAPKKKTAAAKHHSSSTALARRNPTTPAKKAAPKKRTHHKRGLFGIFRIPVGNDVVVEGAKFGGSGIVIGYTQRFVRGLIGSALPAHPLVNAGITLGSAYGLGFVAGMFGPTRPLKRYVEITGWTLFWTQIATTYVLPKLTGGAVAPAQQMAGRRQMSGIGLMTKVPPNVRSLPSAKATAAAPSKGQMGGVGVRPARYSR